MFLPSDLAPCCASSTRRARRTVGAWSKRAATGTRTTCTEASRVRRFPRAAAFFSVQRSLGNALSDTGTFPSFSLDHCLAQAARGRMRRSSRKFPALGRSLTALTLALAGACNRCDAPAQTKYSCNSIDPTAEGCVGDPALGAEAGANPTTYPLGCVAELPYCSPYYPDTHGQPCKCDNLHVLDAGPQWVCPG